MIAVVSVRTEKLTKRYGDIYAVRDVDLEVRDGEIFAVLGPSGCGKTTLLRLIAGLEEPSQRQNILRRKGRDGSADAEEEHGRRAPDLGPLAPYDYLRQRGLRPQAQKTA